MRILRDLLKEGISKLVMLSETPVLDANLLMQHVTKLDQHQLVTKDTNMLTEAQVKQFLALIKRRSQAEPIAYLIHKKPFLHHDFYVEPGVLIPRPDTELLVMTLHDYFGGQMYTFLEIGCGSGAIGISLLALNPQANGLAVDISDVALAVTQKNAQEIGVANRLSVLRSDVFEGVSPDTRYDVIVSNPPYIPTKDLGALMRDVKEFEPHLALDGGEDGLLFYKRICQQAPGYLKPNGLLAFEIGFDQGEAVAELMHKRGYKNVEVLKDLAGHHRVVTGLWRE